jgi:UDP-glucose 4-epimerase
VVITGGLGFVGSNLAHRLVACGARVHLVDSLIPEHGGALFNIRDIAANVSVTQCDIGDGERLPDILRGQHVLFNLAGQTSHWDSMVAPVRDLDINCRAHLALLESIRRYNPSLRVVYASTRQIYGRPAYLPVDEKHPLHPVDVNGINKMAGELYHTLYSELYGIGCVVLRLTNTIGPRMRIKDARQTFFGTWLRHAIEGKPFEVWDGRQLRDINYIDDVVDALLLAASLPAARGTVYNLGATPPLTLLQLADMLTGVTGCRHVTVPFPDDRKTIDIGDYYASYDRIRADLGWEPKVATRTAIEKTVAYYRAHLQHYV